MRPITDGELDLLILLFILTGQKQSATPDDGVSKPARSIQLSGALSNEPQWLILIHMTTKAHDNKRFRGFTQRKAIIHLLKMQWALFLF